MAHCCKKVDAKLPFRRAVRAPIASLCSKPTASERQISRAAASRARVPASLRARVSLLT